MIFIQRNGTTGDVPFTGDQAQILDKSGNVVVGWTSGGIIKGVPQGDGYTLQVKTGSTVKTDTLAIGATIFVLGQSNIQRWFDTPTAVSNAASGTYEMDTDGSIGAVEGAAANYFAKNYAAAAGVPVLMVETAKGGTALLKADDKGNGYWLDTSAGSLYDTARSLLAKVGGKAETVLWGQGETDGSAGVTQSAYAQGLTTFMTRVLADFKVSQVLIQEIGPHGSPTPDDQYDTVRAAQHQVADALAGVDIGAITTDLNTIEDGIHLTGASRVLAADRLLDAALNLQGINTDRTLWTGSSSPTAGDTHTGTDARDELRGLAGDDVLDGAGGSDVILGGDGNDTITGGAGVDLIRGDAGNDVIDGGDDADVISGGTGNDIIKGGAGNDEIWADGGDDIVTGGAGNDYIVGGDGTDTAVFSGNFGGYAVSVSGSTITVRDINTADGDDGTDTLSSIEALQFADRLYDPYGAGLPSLFSNSTDFADFATITAGTYAPNSIYKALAGDDEVYLPKDAAAAQAAGYDPSAIFDAGDGDDIVIGGGLNDYIRGGAGNDLINGGGGSDRMEGGTGNDTYYVDTTAVGTTGDLVVEKPNEGIDTVISTVTFTLKSNVENLTLVGTDAINGTGNELDNVITGNDANNIINANAGNDTINAGGGDDQIRGGLGNDTIDGGEGNDIVLFAGKKADYRIVDNAGVVTVTDLNTADGDEGIDQIRNVETLKFSDGSYVVNIPNGLFTNSADTVDFATVVAGTYTAGTQYAAFGGDDTVYLPKDTAAAQAAGYDPTQAFDAGDGNDTVVGGSLNDWIKGGAGNDILDGGAGSDRMEGGTGDDTYYVDTTSVGTTGDLVVEKAGEGTDTVISTAPSYTLKSNVENLTLAGVADTSGFGNELDNVITGNDGKNSLKGDLGNDTIFGMGGDDNITGGLGNDTIDGGLGRDTVVYAGLRAGYTITFGAPGAATVTDIDPTDGDEGTDTLTGVEVIKFSDASVLVPAGSAPTDVAIDHASVTEHSAAGTLVGTLSAQDPDAGDIFSYSLLDDAGGAYVLSGASLLVAAGDNLDYATAPNTPVTVRVTDGAGHTFDKALTIAVTKTPGIVVSGTDAPDTLTGSRGDDLIDGGKGADTMTGLQGDDTYIVDNTGDKPVEAANGGNDTVKSSVSYTLGANLENLILTGTASNATGNELDNTLTGNDRNNILDGGLGKDAMAGGLGNDTYLVDNVGDVVTEAANAGTDTVKTTLNAYTLTSNVENLTFTGSGNFQGTGNELANTLTGGSGNDLLDGGIDLAKDSLKGGLGDDTYIVRANDSVSESADAGHDTIQTALASYKLPSNVEDLLFTGTGAFQGTGNASDNLIRGGAGNDVLDGGTGNDVLVGGAGNDTYVLDAAGDTVSERVDPNDPNSADAGGNDTIQIKSGLTSLDLNAFPGVENLTYSGKSAFTATGSAVDNVIKTGSGNDLLTGGLGADTLTGGSGADTFLYRSAAEGGDTITDFSQSQGDKIGIAGSAFAGLTAGAALPASFLVAGTSATEAHGQFLYDAQARLLSWDADGTGAGGAVEIAQFSKSLTLKTSDFTVV